MSALHFGVGGGDAQPHLSLTFEINFDSFSLTGDRCTSTVIHSGPPW